MSLMKRFLQETGPLSVKNRFEIVLEQSLSNQLQLEQNVYFIKSLLGLLNELSLDRDSRMGFDENCKFTKILILTV